MSQKFATIFVMALTTLGVTISQGAFANSAVSQPASGNVSDKAIPISPASKAAVDAKTNVKSNNPDVNAGTARGISATIAEPSPAKDDNAHTTPFVVPGSNKVVK